MDSNLRTNLSVEHAVASDRLTDANVAAVVKAVRPVAEKASETAPLLVNLTDPFEAELHGAVTVSDLLCVPGGEDRISVAVLTALIGSKNDAAASALLHAIETVTSGPVKVYVTAEIERLENAGVPCPRWESVLDEPVRPMTAWTCSPILDSGGAPHSILVFEFARAGATHGFVVYRDWRGDGAISKISGIPDIGWRSFRTFLLSGEVFEVPYAIEELVFEEAIDTYDGPRMAMWSRLREDPAGFRADGALATVPGMSLLLENHLTASM